MSIKININVGAFKRACAKIREAVSSAKDAANAYRATTEEVIGVESTPDFFVQSRTETVKSNISAVATATLLDYTNRFCGVALEVEHRMRDLTTVFHCDICGAPLFRVTQEVMQGSSNSRSASEVADYIILQMNEAINREIRRGVDHTVNGGNCRLRGGFVGDPIQPIPYRPQESNGESHLGHQTTADRINLYRDAQSLQNGALLKSPGEMGAEAGRRLQEELIKKEKPSIRKIRFRK